MEKKKGFANTHYPGIKADPNEGMVGIPKEALEFLKGQLEQHGAVKVKKLWETPVLLLGVSSHATAVAEKLLSAGVHRIGVMSMDGSEKSRTSIRELGGGLKSKYSWLEFESFGGLSIDRDVEDILRGFQNVIDCTDQGFDRDVVAEAKKMGLKIFTAVEFSALSEESLSDRLSNQNKSA